ncbi:MAG: hypothetical protein QOI50_5054 [Pseudonocardiales bacterium]|jgi:hypothetical protein|nr:hypothetical protein [Pseudonocardia sp.]MDT7584751.1 hypothetical protein [Pseudonocardiales bacterium]MDT7633124.1 hypothetical protein [Pseudonocardiales bacterium]MDT7686560.1 hypothetical protein [Pseudonocardiales bacterium]
MLSEPEQRVLHEIEQTLVASDPGLASLLANRRAGEPGRVARVVHDVVFVVAAVLGLLCLVLGQIGSGMVALLFAVLVLEVRRARFTVPAAQPTTGQYQA